jgi:hypothetical protein
VGPVFHYCLSAELTIFYQNLASRRFVGFRILVAALELAANVGGAPDVADWPIATFRCAAPSGRYRGIANSGKPTARQIYGFTALAFHWAKEKDDPSRLVSGGARRPAAHAEK